MSGVDQMGQVAVSRITEVHQDMLTLSHMEEK